MEIWGLIKTFDILLLDIIQMLVRIHVQIVVLESTLILLVVRNVMFVKKVVIRHQFLQPVQNVLLEG